MYHLSSAGLKPDARKQFKLLICVTVLAIVVMASLGLKSLLASPSCSHLLNVELWILVQFQGQVHRAHAVLHGLLVYERVHQVIPFEQTDCSKDHFLELKRLVCRVLSGPEEGDHIPDVVFHEFLIRKALQLIVHANTSIKTLSKRTECIIFLLTHDPLFLFLSHAISKYKMDLNYGVNYKAKS